MRLTQKSQVTIPKAVRDAMKIGPGSDVEIERNADGEFVLVNLDERRKGETPGAKLVRQLRETGARARREGWTSGLGTDEIMEMTRGPFDDVDRR